MAIDLFNSILNLLMGVFDLLTADRFFVLLIGFSLVGIVVSLIIKMRDGIS